jgi:hypothetical protein
MRGRRGDTIEHETLIKAGFQMTTDTIGDTYYVGLHRQIVWLFEDGTWRLEPDRQHSTLDEYLEHYRS